MYVDHHGLNWFTIKTWYLLPLISRLLDQLNHVKVFTKVDLRGAYNQVHIWKGDEWKIVVWTHYGHFKYVVMPFGLTNAPTIFQHLMKDVFHEYLDNFVICYINDILIFPITWMNMNDIFNLFWKSLEKLDCMLSWRNANSINSKWNSSSILFINTTFTWILVRSKPLWIKLPQFLFVMFNVFLNLPTSISTSLHIIPW